jgi:hypothetical protein
MIEFETNELSTVLLMSQAVARTRTLAAGTPFGFKTLTNTLHKPVIGGGAGGVT